MGGSPRCLPTIVSSLLHHTLSKEVARRCKGEWLLGVVCPGNPRALLMPQQVLRMGASL